MDRRKTYTQTTKPGKEKHTPPAEIGMETYKHTENEWIIHWKIANEPTSILPNHDIPTHSRNHALRLLFQLAM